MAGVRFLAVAKDFSLLQGVQTGSVSHSAAYPMHTGDKRPRREADRSPPSSADVKNGGAMPALPHMSSWRGHQSIKHPDNFTFTFSYGIYIFILNLISFETSYSFREIK
jgi:hypothetical protein